MVNVFPLLSSSFRTAEDRFMRWQTAASRAMLAASLLFAAVTLAMAGPVMSALYGDEFAAGSDVLQVLALNVVCYSLISVFWRSLVARGRQGTNLALQTFALGMRLSSAVLLIGPLAALGAAISSTLSSMLHLALLARATTRSGAPARLLRLGWRFAAAAGLAGLVIRALAEVTLPVPAVAGGIVVYAVVLRATGAVTEEDMAVLGRLRATRGSGGLWRVHARRS